LNAQTLTDVQVQERARDKRRTELAEMSLSADAGALMIPTDGRDLMDKANTMAAAGVMVKDLFRGNPGACAGLILLCAPYRINPFQASWKCYQTKPDGPLSFEAQLITAMINTAAPISGRLRYAFEGEGATRICIVTATDRDSGEVLEYRSPMVKDIKVKNSPLWVNDPDQQLCYFSSRAFARRHYPEILLGVYDREEMADAAPIRDVTPQGRHAARISQGNSILDALPEDDPPAEEVIEAQPVQTVGPVASDLFADAAIADDPFGLPPVDEANPTLTPEQIAQQEAALAEFMAARDGEAA